MHIRGLAVLLAFPAALLAQDSPFHGGQWAAEFGGGVSFATLGAIRFRSATSALVIDLRVSGGHEESFVGDSFAGVDSHATIGLRLGRRWYNSVVEKVVAHHSLGIQAGFDHSVFVASGLRFIENGWSAGAYAELGGVYLISRHFGIGATGTVAISYGRVKGEDTIEKTHSWSLGGTTGMSFKATLFF